MEPAPRGSSRLALVAVDTLVAMLCVLVAFTVLADLTGNGAISTLRSGSAAGLALISGLMLAFRRRHPVVSLATALATGVGYWALGIPPVGHSFTVVVATYSVAAFGTRREARLGLAAVLGLVVVHQLVTRWVDETSFAGNLVVLGAAWFLGVSTSRRRAETAAHAARALALEVAQLELARRAVTEERLRIARDLHDIVAHSMSVIAINAGTGRLAFDRDPDAARSAFATIETTCREALGEMRGLLGVLRAGDPDATPTLAPPPTLAEVDELVASATALGIAVELRIDGERGAMAPTVDVTAYRIVQEALTNVGRHSPARRATVAISYGAAAVVIEVVSPPGLRRGSTEPDVGRLGVGLTGMRERVAACGGTLAASPQTGGGFRVLARLPREPVSARSSFEASLP